MTTKFYLDAQGKYLGGFDGVEVVEPAIEAVYADDGETVLVEARPEKVTRIEPKVPAGAIEIPEPPAHGLDVYDVSAKTWTRYVEAPEADPALMKMLDNPLNVAALKAALGVTSK